MRERAIEEIKEDLVRKIEDCRFVIDNLKDNAAFKKVLSDFEQNKKTIDDHWHFVTDPGKLLELRVTKLATNSILNVLDAYQSDLDKAKADLDAIDNQDTKILKDYDPN